MNKLLQKVAKIFLGLSMAAGVGVAVGISSKEASPVHADGSYTITFSNSANGATALSSSVAATTTIAQASRTYVESKPYTINSGNNYYGGDGKNNIRMGKSGNSAGLSIALSSTGSVSATSIIVNCKNFNSSNAGTLNVNSIGAQSVPSSAGNLTFTYNSATSITSITLATTKATFIYSITVNYSTTPTTVYATSVEIGKHSDSTTPAISNKTITIDTGAGSGSLTEKLTATATGPNSTTPTDATVTWSKAGTNVGYVSSWNAGDNVVSFTINTSSPGTFTVTASADGAQTANSVTDTITYVIETPATLTGVSKDADPTKKTGYTDGDTLDVTGMEVYAIWDSVKDTSVNLKDDVVWANGGVLSEGQTEITGYIPDDTGHSFPITVQGLSVSAPSYTNTFNIKGNYRIKHSKVTSGVVGTTYYLKSNGDSSVPSAVTDVDEATIFTFKLVADNTFEIKCGTDYLYTTDANNGLRVGSTQQSWGISVGTRDNGDYDLQNKTYTSRYLSLYSTQDFRTYAADASNRTENTDLEAVKAVSSFDVIADEGAQTRFLKGNPFDYSTAGYTAQLTYDDNSTEDVSSSATWTLDTSTTGLNKTLTVSYTKGETLYSDTVTGLEVYVVIADSLSIDKSNATVEYEVGASLVTTGLVINGLDNNEQVVIANISPTVCSFSPSTLNSVGDAIEITVSYTNDDQTIATGTYTVKVENNVVTNLSWSKRPGFNSEQSNYSTIWAGETTLGDLITANGSDGAGVFAPTWKYAKEDSPSFGTGEHQVHIGLYDVASPTVEGQALSSSHVFTAAENDKYVVAFYEGKASTQNKKLSVQKWRSVIGDNTFCEIFDYSAGTSTPEKSGDIPSATIALTGASQTAENSWIRLGSGSKTGALTVTSSTYQITKIVINAKYYQTDTGTTMKIGDDDPVSITNEFADYDVTYSTAVSSVTVASVASSKRVCINKVTIYSAQKNVEIGKTDDCLGLESYIETYLHMSDYTTSQGWCKDNEHNYYGKNTETGAKYYFNQLNLHQRTLLSSNSAYADEWARLNAWAAANGESLNGSTLLAARQGISPLVNIIGENTNTVAIIVIISMVSVTAIGGYFFLRKKKEQ